MPDQFLDSLSERIDGLRKRPGSKAQSLSDSSFDAWVKFNRRTPDDINSTVSFYQKGALVSQQADFEIRRRTRGARSLERRRLTAENTADQLQLFDAGEEVELHYLRHDDLGSVRLKLTGRPSGDWKVPRSKDPTYLQKTSYKKWLGREWPDEGSN